MVPRCKGVGSWGRGCRELQGGVGCWACPRATCVQPQGWSGFLAPSKQVLTLLSRALRAVSWGQHLSPHLPSSLFTLLFFCPPASPTHPLLI